MTKPLVLVFFILLYLTTPGQVNSDELLKSVQSKYNSLNSLSVNFDKSSGAKQNFSGKLFLKKDDRMKLVLKNNTIITDGKTFWNYDKKQKKVIINNYDPSDPSEFSLNSFINEYPSKCTVSSSDEGEFKTLTFVPKTSELNFKKAELYIGNDNLIRKLVIDDNTGESTISLSGYTLNPDISDSDFTFSPPEGIKIIDLR